MGKRLILTPEDEHWLKTHYANMTSDDIAEHLGLMLNSVRTLARRWGLQKSDEFMRRKCMEGAKMVRYMFKHGMISAEIKGRELTKFKPGHKLPEEAIRKRTVHAQETIRKIRDEERRRVAQGLPQLTKLGIGMPDGLRYLRYRLRKHGYVLDDVHKIAYYGKETRRMYKTEKYRKEYEFRSVAEYKKAK